MASEKVTDKVSALGLQNILEGLGAGAQAANTLVGTQLGAGIQPSKLDAATPLSFIPTQLIVLQTPTMWTDLSGTDSDKSMGAMLKALIESHAKSVSGIDFGYTLETAEQPVGHDGQNIMTPTQSKRTPVSPSFVFPEVTGNLVWNFFKQWVYDIQDPDTNGSMARFTNVKPFVNSAYSMSMLAIQFDRTMRAENIIDCAFYTNMFPTDPGGLLGLERQIGQTKVMERTVNFTGHVQHTAMTRKLGIEIATALNLHKLRYNNVDPTVTSVADGLQNSGLEKELQQLGVNPTP